MLEKFTYTNNFNETLEFGKDHLFVNENDLRDFAWDITSKNNKISGFKKGIVSKTIPVTIKCDTELEGIQLRNRLFEVFEKDVLTNRHGKLHIGDYYLRCFIVGIKNSQYLLSKRHMIVELSVQTDFPHWVKETTHEFVNDGAAPSQTHLDFPYDFPYDFGDSYTIKSEIFNENFMPSNFILTIFGGVVDPELFIGDHRYAVNTKVDTNAYLTINSIEKTIVLTKVNGEKVNCFNDRDKDSYIFEKIPVGNNKVSLLNHNFNFNITLLEERGEPKWT